MHRCNYIIPSDNWEQQQPIFNMYHKFDYIIPSDNWEQQPSRTEESHVQDYIIPSDNWEQQLYGCRSIPYKIISYQAITGNNNE